MKRHALMVGAAVLLVLGCAVGGWAVLSRGDAEAPSPPSPVVAIPERSSGHAAGGGAVSDGRASRAHVRSAQKSAGQAEGAGPADPAPPEPAAEGAAGRPSPGGQLALPSGGQPIAWLRRGAWVALRTEPGGKLVKRLRWRTPFGSRTVLAAFARRGPWFGAPTPLLPDGQLGWVRLDPSRLRSGWTAYSIDIDLSSRTARLRRDGRVVRSFAVTVGSSASPTPTGRFAITDTFRGHLNPAYGCCALATTATQPSLPSGWLGGSRIAIHGTTGPLGVAVSHGCIRAANDDVSALVAQVGLGTPVVVRR